MSTQQTTEPEVPEVPEADAPPMPGEGASTMEIAARTAQTPVSRRIHELVMSDDEIRRTWRVAAALAQSGMFKGERSKCTAEEAFAKILIGRDLGISSTQALMTVDLVHGAVQLRGVLLASFVRRSPDYEYKITEHDAEHCKVQLLGFPHVEPADDTLVLFRGKWWEILGESEFTVADATTAGLVKTDSNWTKYPRNMVLWRALSNAVKFYAPDLMGGVPVYVEGELPPATPSLTQGSGDGSTQGLDLGPDVEAVLERATTLGHAGLADRATAEMALGGRPPADVARWVTEANRVLDEMVPDADVVDPASGPTAPSDEPPPEQPADDDRTEEVDAEPVDPVEAANRAGTMRAEALALADQADAAEAEGDDAGAAELREQADAIHAEADAIAAPEQGDLGF